MNKTLGDRLSLVRSLRGAIVANVLVLSMLIYVAVLHDLDINRYNVAMQEDGILEWMTFWAFALAGGIYLRLAARDLRSGNGVAGLPFGLR